MTRCSICFEDDSSVVVVHETPGGIPHEFHGPCIAEWIANSHNTECPLCRAPLPVESLITLLNLKGGSITNYDSLISRIGIPAARNGEVDTIEQIIEMVRVDEISTELTEQMIIGAAEEGQAEILGMLLDAYMTEDRAVWEIVARCAVLSGSSETILVALETYRSLIGTDEVSATEMAGKAFSIACARRVPDIAMMESIIDYLADFHDDVVPENLSVPLEEVIREGLIDSLHLVENKWPSLLSNSLNHSWDIYMEEAIRFARMDIFNFLVRKCDRSLRHGVYMTAIQAAIKYAQWPILDRIFNELNWGVIRNTRLRIDISHEDLESIAEHRIGHSILGHFWDAGFFPRGLRPYGTSLVTQAAAYGRLYNIKVMVERMGAVVDHHWTLKIAAVYGYVEILTYLIDRLNSLNQCSLLQYSDLVSTAAHYGQTDFIKTLLLHAPFEFLIDTACYEAATKGHRRAFDLLIRYAKKEQSYELDRGRMNVLIRLSQRTDSRYSELIGESIDHLRR